ncbi:hypothetical protein IVA88_14745 [Bradyrhizobium sp. 149]|nr:hypothetical protein [Bradyrhizobium sp. 149]MCK1652690.1 hypothetical protein [Bradyrhizobium sp. 149]
MSSAYLIVTGLATAMTVPLLNEEQRASVSGQDAGLMSRKPRSLLSGQAA